MTHEILDERKITPMQFCILALCFFSTMLDGFDILIISFTAPAMSQELGISSEQLGLVFSAALLGMAVGALFMSSIADIYGRRLVVTAALFASGGATVAIYFSTTVTELIAMRFITGIGLGTLVAVVPGLGGEYSPLRNRSFILSILVAGVAIGSVVGGVVSSWAIPLIGWRNLYLYSGLLIIITGLVFFVVVPESIQYLLTRRRDTALDRINRILRYIRQTPIAALPEPSPRPVESATVTSLLTPGRRTTTLLTWGAFFLGFAGVYFTNSWLPKLLVDAGISAPLAIKAVVILNFGAITGTLGIGLLSRWWPLKTLLVGAFTTATVLMVVLSLFMRPADDGMIMTIWLLCFVIGITLQGGFGNMYTIALTIYPAQIRITGLGWCIGLGRAGGIISPALAGLLLGMEMSSANVLAWFAIIVAFGALVIKLVTVKEMA